MDKKPSLYNIKTTAKTGQLSVKSVWNQTGASPMPSGFTLMFSMQVDGKSYVVGVNAKNKASVYSVTDKKPFLAPVASNIAFDQKWDSITQFVIGNMPYLMCYNTTTGFAFYPVLSDLSLGKPYSYARNHAPAMTDGFSSVAPFTIFGAVYFIGYSFDTGKVCIYTLDVTATSAPGTPPLVANYTWDHVWAKNWTRFAFFQMGGENFFLKTNVGKPNVNIDHINDDASAGSVEVGSYLDLENAQKLDIVRAFYIGVDPYFISYMKNGTTTFNRFNSDCKGWTTQAAMPTVSGATQIVTVNAGDESFALFY